MVGHNQCINGNNQGGTMKLKINAILTIIFVSIFTSTAFASYECMPRALEYAVKDLAQKFKDGHLEARSWQRDGLVVLDLKGIILNQV